jgi:putative nucleotidyltransferase with HDIG domain
MNLPPEAPGVLFVDDERNILRALTRLCRDESYRVFAASSAEQAFHTLEDEAIHVVVSDQQMPETLGVSLLSQIRDRHPEVLRIMLTGYMEMDVAVEAINKGEVYRLLTKPWNDDELRATIRQALEAYAMRREIERLDELIQGQNRELQGLNRTLEEKVRDRTEQLKEKHQELHHAYVATMRALAEAVDAKDPHTRGHSERVAVYGSRIARELGCEGKFIERIYIAALLHDIGKIGVPDEILGKPGRLTPGEYDLMKLHPTTGARILEPVSFLQDLVPWVRHHHEWYDGSEHGYPDRLHGDEIPYASRIILVADTVEAMSSNRPYRTGQPMEVVIDEIQRFRGTQFDPQAAEALLSILEREGQEFIERASKFDIDAFLTEAADPQ